MQTAAKIAIAVIIIVLAVILYTYTKKPTAPPTNQPAMTGPFNEGSVVQCMQNGAIYLITNGTKRHFTPAGYVGWPAPVQYTDCSALNAIPNGVDI